VTDYKKMFVSKMEGYLVHQIKTSAGFESWCLTNDGLIRFFHKRAFNDFVIAHNCEFEINGARLVNVELNQRLPLTPKQRVFLLYLHELLFRAKDFFCDNDELFEYYEAALMGLLKSESEYVERKILRQFEITLLKLAGFAIDFKSDDAQKDLSAERYYDFYSEIGFKAGSLYSGKILLELGDNQFTSKEHFKTVQHILKKILPNIIGKQDINTRQLWHLLK
jgi:recombinational DNA repair protein (RecF pathway)